MDLSAEWLRTHRATRGFDPFREQLALAAKVDACLGFRVAMDATRGVKHAGQRGGGQPEFRQN